MTPREFRNFAAKKLTRAFIDGGIVSEEHSFEVGFAIESAIEAAVTHHAITTKAAADAALSALSSALNVGQDEQTTENDLIKYISEFDPFA